MSYSKKIEEFIKVKLETISSDSTIARLVLNNFTELNKTHNAVRKKVSDIRNNRELERSREPIKRLFFDIETTYQLARVWRTGKQYISGDQIFQETRIICVSYKWQYEDKVHTLKWNSRQDDSKLVEDFIKILGEADECIAHNGDRFDIKQIRTRAIKQGKLMYPNYRTLDTLKKSRKYFSFNSNKLDYLGKFLGVGEKLDHEGFSLWVKIQEDKDEDALKRMIAYCEQDVILLEDVFHVLNPYIDHNTNYAVLKGGKKWQCPNCGSSNVKMHRTDTTAMGWVRRFMRCGDCKKDYKISNKSYLNFLSDYSK